MLVLSRKEGEKLIFICGEERFHVEVKEIGGKRIRLAIDASENVRVIREEVFDETRVPFDKEAVSNNGTAEG